MLNWIIFYLALFFVLEDEFSFNEQEKITLGSELSDNETPFLVIRYPDNETKGSDIKS